MKSDVTARTPGFDQRYNSGTVPNRISPVVDLAAKTAPIFALPDHHVITSLLPDIEDRRLSIHEASERIRSGCWVPIAINPGPDSPLLYFADLGTYQYREWQHIYSVQQLAQSGRIADYFSTPAELLDIPDLVAEPRKPRGFILHMSRCGSTLLGKVLARADGIGIINQPSVLQHGFWSWITGSWQSRRNWRPESNALNLVRFRNLLNLLCRRRLDNEHDIFIKFISWNSLYVDFIHAAFADVPTLFLYRDPVEVIASVFRETSAVLLARGSRQAEFLAGKGATELDAMDDVAYLCSCYAHYFRAILDAQPQPKLLSFAAFAPDALEKILAAAFALQPDSHQLRQMHEQFSVYSKDDRNQTGFKDDSQSKHEMLSDDHLRLAEQYCRAAWRKLSNSPQNII